MIGTAEYMVIGSGCIIRLPRYGILMSIMLVAWLGFSSPATSNESVRLSDEADAYLKGLPGFWKGVAVETPVGSMNYDIFFHTCKDGTIAGVAQTGASLHYWQFMPDRELPRLRFLSTFRGNRTPALLLSRSSDESTLNYYAPELEILSLQITFTASTVDIRVFHHGRPHVHIRLTRKQRRPAELSSHSILANSCRGYPISDQIDPD
ncbi:MAG: hypothetical protein GY703_06930 [Gammaproteobacteria bacterium]|nr:hypothetical protein [Gammaproteobacteria bacterium]